MSKSIDQLTLKEWYKDYTGKDQEDLRMLVTYVCMKQFIERNKLKSPLSETKEFYLTPLGEKEYQKYLDYKK